NTQAVVSSDEVHGTAVSSGIGAPSHGVGLVGVYPQAALQEWDFSDGSLSEILAGLDAATKRGRSVINISGGFLGFDALLEQGVDRALRRGAIVVAAVGNDRQSGNRSFVPASLPHVLTVGATDQSDHFAFFSNRSSALDLAAPGVSIPVAVPTFFNASGFASFDGTSFSAPLVAGAAAWVWTVRPDLDPTQLEDVYRDWVPAPNRTSAMTHRAANVNVALWGPKTRTVFERGSALKRDLLAFSQRSGSRPDTVGGRDTTRAGAFYYVDVFLGKRV